MALPMEKLKREAEEERRRLAAGERPRSRFTSKVQRTAAKALAAFFVLMLALTLLARAADGVTVAKVKAETPKTGILTQRFETGGTIQPQGDLTLTLPAGIGIERLAAEKGQRVQAGDVLLELDSAGIARTLNKLRDDMRILELKLANAALGNTSDTADALLEAQRALERAQEDYDRLVSTRDRTEGRAGEDLAEAQAQYDEAVQKLEKARVRAKEELIKSAREKVKAAEKNLEAVREAALDAIIAAEEQLEAGEEAADSADRGLDGLRKSLALAKSRYEAAKEKYDALVEAGTGTAEELKRLEDEMTLAKQDMDSAQEALLSGGNTETNSDLDKLKNNLKKLKEREYKKIEEAETELQEAKDALQEAENQKDLSEEPLVVSAQGTLDAAEAALKSARRSVEDADAATDDALFTAQRALETAQQGVADAEKKARQAGSADEKTRRQAEIERLGYQSDKRELQAQIDGVQAVADAGGKLVAPVSGTVEYLVEETGKTQEGVKVAVLSRSDRGFVYQAEVDEKDAEKLSTGDEGTITYTQEGKSRTVAGRISAIGAADDKGKVTISVTLPEGMYPGGVSAKLEISKRSEQYQNVLPLSALRSDSGGSFVLVLREKQTVMGVEQTVARVEVTPVEQDSQQMAVESAALLYDDKVVVSANKPIAEGDRVRLETGEQDN